MKIVDLENINGSSFLFLTGQEIHKKYQPHKSDVDILNWIPRKYTKVDPQKTSEHSKMRNFFARNLCENCECYVLFESSAFAIKESQRKRNKNCITGINNQKQPWKGDLNIE